MHLTQFLTWREYIPMLFANSERLFNSLQEHELPARCPEHANMHMSGESLLVIVVVGVVAGWLAGQIVQGTGFGLVGDLVIGIIGAFIGSWLLPQLNVHIGAGIVSAIANATVGAMILLVLIRAVRGSGRFGRRGW